MFDATPVSLYIPSISPCSSIALQHDDKTCGTIIEIQNIIIENITSVICKGDFYVSYT